MTLLNQIKAAQLQSRKDKNADKTALLTTLIGDAVMVGKNNGNRESTDAEVIATIKKFINTAKESLNMIASRTFNDPNSNFTNAADQLITEIQILKTFLPEQLSDDKLSVIIDGIINNLSEESINNPKVSMRDMGKVMKILKEKYDGLYDGNYVSALVKQKLVNFHNVQ